MCSLVTEFPATAAAAQLLRQRQEATEVAKQRQGPEMRSGSVVPPLPDNPGLRPTSSCCQQQQAAALKATADAAVQAALAAQLSTASAGGAAGPCQCRSGVRVAAA